MKKRIYVILYGLLVVACVGASGLAEPSRKVTKEQFSEKMGWSRREAQKKVAAGIYEKYSSLSASPAYQRLIEREMSRRERRRRLAQKSSLEKNPK